MIKHDGGPAFARARDGGSNSQEGMSLLDYFAAEALNGMLSNSPSGSPSSWAIQAYECAEAMIAERDRRMVDRQKSRGYL